MGACLSKKQAVAPNKVHPEFDEEKDYLGQRGYSKTLKSADGVDLFAYFWPANPDVPLKGIIQLAHGSAAYTCFDFLKFKGAGLPNVYEGSWVEAFNRAGFSVCGIDHQGYGRSKGGRLGNKFQTHVDNLLLLSEDVLENGSAAFPKGLAYFLVGHSMGGLVATLACIKQPERFSGLVLLSPLLTMEASGKRSGSLKLGAKSRPKSDDGDTGSTSSERPVPWIHEAWAADPFVADGGPLSSRQVEELVPPAAQLAAEGGMEGVVAPLLIMQSERDTYVDPEGARKLHERAASSDKTLRLLSQQWHVLTKEEGSEELLTEAIAWLTARATNSGALTKGLDGGQGAVAAAAKDGGEAQQRQQGGGGKANPEVEGAAGRQSAAPPGCTGEDGGEAAAGGDAGAEAAAAAAAKRAAGAEGKEANGAAGTSGGGEEAAEAEKPERNSAPVLARSMSMLERMPEHEPLAPSSLDTKSSAEAGGPPLPARRYSFSGRMPRAVAAPGDTTPTASGASLLGPLPPLGRRNLGALPDGLYGRGRLAPLPPLLDRKPIG